jgi:hypothetical protein
MQIAAAGIIAFGAADPEDASARTRPPRRHRTEPGFDVPDLPPVARLPMTNPRSVLRVVSAQDYTRCVPLRVGLSTQPSAHAACSAVH